MNRKIAAVSAMLGLFALSPFDGRAQLYKWVDENGEIHYSDQPPAQEVEAAIVEIEDHGGQKRISPDNDSTRPIIRPYEKASRRLHLLDTRYLWKRESHSDRVEKVGIYHIGKACTTRGAIKAPDVFIHHDRLLPSEAELAQRIERAIEGLDYDSERTEEYRLLARLEKTRGLGLYSEIVALDFLSCAPGVYGDERLEPVHSIGAHRFKRHRVKLRVDWQLREGRDQQVVYEASTDGAFNGWGRSGGSRAALGNALEDALLKLFARPDFIAEILSDGDPADLAGEQPAAQEEDGTSLLSGLFGDRYLLQAQAAQAFAEINALKVGSLQYFMTEGRWPDDPTEMGFPGDYLDDSDTLSHVELKTDGSIRVELDRLFGDGKLITLSPKISEGGAVGMARWRCSSNLEQTYLPSNCEGL